MKRVLIGMITSSRHAYCQDSAIYSIMHQTNKNFDWKVVELSKGDENYNHLLERYGKEHIVKGEWFEEANKRTAIGRERIRQIGIEGNYDYIFFCDGDWILPKGLIDALLSHNKKLVGILYNYAKGKLSYPSVAKSGMVDMETPARNSLDRLDLFTWEEIMELAPRLIRCYGAGIGLVSREVFTKIPWRYCPVYPIGDDVQFWHETNDKGFEWWVDLSFKVPHLNVNWSNVGRIF